MEKRRQLVVDSKEIEWAGVVLSVLWEAAISGRKEDFEFWTSLEVDQQAGLNRSKFMTAGEHFTECQTAVLKGDAERSAELLPGLLEYPPFFSSFGAWPDARALAGMVSKTCGQLDDAAEYLDESLSNSRETKQPPAIALNSGELAAVLLERDAPGDHDRAVELQDEAIATEFGMKPLLERVLSQREILKA